MGNPDWTKDEHILALDVYFQHPEARNSKMHPAVIELSQLLNSLPIHSPEDRGEDFRNPNGIGMKLSNFKRCDPSYEGVGLQRGAKLEEEVWNEFASDPKKLHEAALAIQENAKGLSYDVIEEVISDDEEAIEGRVLTVTHKRRERDPKITKRKKQKVLQETGTLACEACGFDFKGTYGDLGDSFAECHHEKPVSELKAGEMTKLGDLCIVCSNCHRMIHRSKPWLSVAGLRDLINAAGFVHKKTGKLVRDKIPEIIRNDGRVPIVKQLVGDELIAALHEKLTEERYEYNAANSNEEKIEELADMLEVILAIAQQKGVSEREFGVIVKSKREKRGGFSKGNFYEGDKEYDD